MLYPNFVQTNYTAVVDIGLQLANQTERYFNRWPNVCACNSTHSKGISIYFNCAWWIDYYVNQPDTGLETNEHVEIPLRVRFNSLLVIISLMLFMSHQQAYSRHFCFTPQVTQIKRHRNPTC